MKLTDNMLMNIEKSTIEKVLGYCKTVWAKWLVGALVGAADGGELPTVEQFLRMLPAKPENL